MYHCGNYPRVPVGTLCKSAHRIIKRIHHKKNFTEEIQSHIEDRQTVDFTEQKKRMAVCEKRIGELEVLIAKIYEDIGETVRQALHHAL